MSGQERRPGRSLLARWLEKLGLQRRELQAWAMYDWANSAFMTTILAAVFPVYFSQVAAADLPEGAALARFGIATPVSILIIVLMSPVLGAVADYSGTRKRWLGAFMLLGAGSVGSMFFIHHGDWLLALVLFMLASISASGSFVFYDALLPHIAREDEIDRVSTAGFALGYIGGGFLLAVQLAWITNPAAFGLPAGPDLTPSEQTLPARLAMGSVGLWWIIFSIPLFLGVAEPRRRLEPDEEEGLNPFTVAFDRLRETFRELRGYRQAFLMLLAFLIYNDGIGTIIRMAAIYGSEIGIDRDAMIAAILITQFVGVPFAFLFGILAGRFGAKRCIFLGLVVYMGITVLGFRMATATDFLILAVLVGTVQGGTQALSRSLFATLVPKHKSGEFFGFYGVMDRFGGFMGTTALTLMAAWTGSPRFGILAVILFFLVGALLLSLVNVREGQLAAQRAELETREAGNS